MSYMKINEHEIIKESIEYSGQSLNDKMYINCRFKDRPLSIDINMQYELLNILKKSPVKITNDTYVDLGYWHLVRFNIREEKDQTIITTLYFEKANLTEEMPTDDIGVIERK